MSKQRKYGLKIDRPQVGDYIFGASPLPMTEIQPDGDWTPFLPMKEYQDLNGVEPFACVTFTILNCIEILIKQQYGETRNYSDRFLAAVSGTKEGGNSPQIVCEFLRKIGVVPQELWPFDSTVTSFDIFYEQIPPKLYELAREFNTEWDFKHEFVPSTPELITQALKCSPLLFSVPAWFQNSEGKYYRPEGMQDNHATTLIMQKEGDFRRIFDSYEDPGSDDNKKDVVWECIPMVVKRFQVTRKAKPIKSCFLKRLFANA